MTTQKKQGDTFSPGKKETERADEKKKSFEQGIQNNNTAGEAQSNPLPDKNKEKDAQDNNGEPVEERSDKLTK